MNPAFAVLLVLSGIAAWQTVDNCNPDAISYLLLAEHWRAGDFDLAITAYWSPAFVWLLVPLAQLLPAWIALRVAMVVSAVVFWFAARSAMRGLGLSPSACTLAAWLLVPMAAAAVGKEVSPDLLGAGLFVLGTARVLRPGAAPRWLHDLATGLLFGFAYLVKAANLPSAAVVVGITFVLRRASGGLSTASLLTRGGWLLLGTALVAGPWIALLTQRAGTLTVSTAATHNHAVMGGPLGQREHPVWTTLHEVPAGRLTAWEDPPASLYTPWSPFASWERFEHQLAVVRDNVPVLRRRLLAADWLGVGAACALLAALLRCRRRDDDDATHAASPAAPGWAWSLLPLAAIGASYLPFYADSERYFYACVPFALAAALGLVADSPLAAGGWHRRLALAVIAGSFLAVSVPSLAKTALGDRIDVEARDARAIADTVRAAGGKGPIAGVGTNGHVGLYVGWLLRQPFAGNSYAADGDAQLERVGARLAVVGTSSPAAARLAMAPGWQRLGADRDWSVQVFQRRE